MTDVTMPVHAAEWPAGSWRLTDLIDVRTLQSIQDTFARAFGLPTVIVHPDGTNATDITHRVSFCEDFTRGSGRGGPRCSECDLSAMSKAGRTGQPAIFHCWNGLYDCAIPIAPKGQVLGYFLCGQVLTGSPDAEHYAAVAEELGVSAGAYLDALREVRQLPFESYEAAVQSMHVLAGMIAEQAAASIDSLQMLQEARASREDASRLLGELEGILSGLVDVGSQRDYHSTLEAVAENLDQLIPWDSCVIYLLEDDQDELIPAVVRDPYPDAIRTHRPSLGTGVIGKVAVTGIGRRVIDVTSDPDFDPIPGVPIEPESLLAVPMVYRDAISGVIVLSRLERRTFSDHELRVLEVFSSQASVAIQLSKLASSNAQRLREERALGRLLRASSSRLSLDALLRESVEVGVEVLEADAALVVVPGGSSGRARTVAIGLSEDEAEELAGTDAGTPRDAVASFAWRGRSALTLLLGSPQQALGSAIFIGPAGAQWDRRLAAGLASQAALGIENARLHDRERRQLREYRLLSELGADLARASALSEIEDRLLASTPEMLGADFAWLALAGEGPDAVEVIVRHGGGEERLTLSLEGAGRVAALRVRDEPAVAASVFETWAGAVAAAVQSHQGVRSFLAAPLSGPTGTLGGLFAGWGSPDVPALPEEERVLRVVASTAGASLARLAAYEQTDSSLRERVTELQGLTRFAERITALTERGPLVQRILAAFKDLAQLEAAVLGRFGAGGLEIERDSGGAQNVLSELSAALAAHGPIERETRVHTADGNLQVIAFPLRGSEDSGAAGAFFAGIGRPGDDRQRDRILATLARYGSVALENVQLHGRRRQAIARLEQKNEEIENQAERLKRILSVHETLASAVLEGRGLESMAARLGRFLEGELLIVAAPERVLARWPEDTAIDWRPTPDADPATGVVSAADGTLLAAPVTVGADQLAWVIARLDEPASDFARAALEYAALLTALELLRERTAIEVETRLRGGFLEDLIAGEVRPELLAEQALALGLDLRRPSRVFLVQASARRGAPRNQPTGPVDPELLFGTVEREAGAWSRSNLVALRGTLVVAIVPEESDDAPTPAEERFEDRLRPALESRAGSLSVAIAVGTLCGSPEEYRQSFTAGRHGLDLMRLLGREDQVFSFRAASVETILLQASEPSVILDFIQRYIEPLARYDRAHSSQLRHTLETYFDAGANLEETARRLHVHVSTLRYRLGKAASLTGVDLKDRRSALDLHVALRAATTLGITSAQG